MSNVPRLFDLSGRVALVTGGSRGIGKAIARGFAEAGANIVLVSRNEGELEKVSDEIGQATGVKVSPVAADLSHRAEAKAVADRALDAFGRVDVLVNNAGGNKPQPID